MGLSNPVKEVTDYNNWMRYVFSKLKSVKRPVRTARMAQRMDKDDPLVPVLRNYKHDNVMKTLGSYEDLIKTSDGKHVIASIKVDGELTALGYDGTNVRLVSLEGRVRIGLPLVDEAQRLLTGVSSAIFVGDLFGVDISNKELPYPQAISLLRKPVSEKDEKRIRIAIFDVLAYNGKDYRDEDYETRAAVFTKVFENGSYVQPAYVAEADTDLLKKLWESQVLDEGHEGLVIRTDGTYKIKPVNSADLSVVGVERSKTHDDWAGALLLAFVDNDNVFRNAGKVGGGFTHPERREWLKWAEANKIAEVDGYIYVDPFKSDKVVEVRYIGLNLSERPSWTVREGQIEDQGDRQSATLRQPALIRVREDKHVDPKDVGIYQLPTSKVSVKTAAEPTQQEPKPYYLRPDEMLVELRKVYGQEAERMMWEVDHPDTEEWRAWFKANISNQPTSGYDVWKQAAQDYERIIRNNAVTAAINSGVAAIKNNPKVITLRQNFHKYDNNPVKQQEMLDAIYNERVPGNDKRLGEFFRSKAFLQSSFYKDVLAVWVRNASVGRALLNVIGSDPNQGEAAIANLGILMKWGFDKDPTKRNRLLELWHISEEKRTPRDITEFSQLFKERYDKAMTWRANFNKELQSGKLTINMIVDQIMNGTGMGDALPLVDVPMLDAISVSSDRSIRPGHPFYSLKQSVDKIIQLRAQDKPLTRDEVATLITDEIVRARIAEDSDVMGSGNVPIVSTEETLWRGKSEDDVETTYGDILRAPGAESFDMAINFTSEIKDALNRAEKDEGVLAFIDSNTPAWQDWERGVEVPLASVDPRKYLIQLVPKFPGDFEVTVVSLSTLDKLRENYGVSGEETIVDVSDKQEEDIASGHTAFGYRAIISIFEQVDQEIQQAKESLDEEGGTITIHYRTDSPLATAEEHYGLLSERSRLEGVQFIPDDSIGDVFYSIDVQQNVPQVNRDALDQAFALAYQVVYKSEPTQSASELTPDDLQSYAVHMQGMLEKGELNDTEQANISNFLSLLGPSKTASRMLPHTEEEFFEELIRLAEETSYNKVLEFISDPTRLDSFLSDYPDLVDLVRNAEDLDFLSTTIVTKIGESIGISDLQGELPYYEMGELAAAMITYLQSKFPEAPQPEETQQEEPTGPINFVTEPPKVQSEHPGQDVIDSLLKTDDSELSKENLEWKRTLENVDPNISPEELSNIFDDIVNDMSKPTTITPEPQGNSFPAQIGLLDKLLTSPNFTKGIYTIYVDYTMVDFAYQKKSEHNAINFHVVTQDFPEPDYIEIETTKDDVEKDKEQYLEEHPGMTWEDVDAIKFSYAPARREISPEEIKRRNDADKVIKNVSMYVAKEQVKEIGGSSLEKHPDRMLFYQKQGLEQAKEDFQDIIYGDDSPLLQMETVPELKKRDPAGYQGIEVALYNRWLSRVQRVSSVNPLSGSYFTPEEITELKKNTALFDRLRTQGRTEEEEIAQDLAWIAQLRSSGFLTKILDPRAEIEQGRGWYAASQMYYNVPPKKNADVVKAYEELLLSKRDADDSTMINLRSPRIPGITNNFINGWLDFMSSPYVTPSNRLENVPRHKPERMTNVPKSLEKYLTEHEELEYSPSGLHRTQPSGIPPGLETQKRYREVSPPGPLQHSQYWTGQSIIEPGQDLEWNTPYGKFLVQYTGPGENRGDVNLRMLEAPEDLEKHNVQLGIPIGDIFTTDAIDLASMKLSKPQYEFRVNEPMPIGVPPEKLTPEMRQRVRELAKGREERERKIKEVFGSNTMLPDTEEEFFTELANVN